MRAVAAQREPEPERRVCKRGHDLTAPNALKYATGGRDGVARPRCRLCVNLNVAISAERRRGTDGNYYQPRAALAADDPGLPVARVDSLFARLPKHIRDVVASILLDDTFDPPIRDAYRRVANEKAWVMTSEAHATGLLIYGLLDIAMEFDTTPPDVLLAPLFVA